MGRTPVKMEDMLHMQMKEVAKGKNRSIQTEYDDAIKFYLKYVREKEIARVVDIEGMIKNSIGRMEDHLASFIGRVGIDNAIGLMGIVMIYEDFMKEQGKEINRNELFDTMRARGAQYFSSAIQKDKASKKEGS